MNTLVKTFSLTALIALAGASYAGDEPGAAAAGKGRHHKGELFEKIDTNHDGMISRAEWEAFKAAHKGQHRKGEKAEK